MTCIPSVFIRRHFRVLNVLTRKSYDFCPNEYYLSMACMYKESKFCDLTFSILFAMSNKRQLTDSLQVNFVSIPESLETKFCKDFPNYVEGLIQSEPGNYVTTPPYTKAAQGIYNMNLRPDDVFVMSFPKCGKSFFFRSFKYIFSIS